MGGRLGGAAAAAAAAEAKEKALRNCGTCFHCAKALPIVPPFFDSDTCLFLFLSLSLFLEIFSCSTSSLNRDIVEIHPN